MRIPISNGYVTTKQEAMRLIEGLPENVSLEDIQYHLYVLAKIERGRNELREGKGHTQEEVESLARKWIESSGRRQQ